MALPASFLKDGFLPYNKLRKRPRVMIGTEGETDSGKSEFILSAPGPGIVLCLDRGFEPMLDNPHPPATRREDFAFKVIQAPMAPGLDKAVYTAAWNDFYAHFKAATTNADALTVAIDGDSDSWEIQRLAEHGKLSGVWPQTKFGDVYAARRAMINRAWDSRKNIIATNRMASEFEVVKKADGTIVLDDKDQPKKVPTGQRVRQGFPDQNYLWQIQLRHLFVEKHYGPKGQMIPAQWGIRILKCKANTELVGEELWGSDCNFQTLVQLVYPNIPLEDWGY